MSENDSLFEELFSVVRVLGIFRGHGPERTVELCHAARDAGVVAVEIPVQDERGFASLAAAVNAGRDRDRIVGAGTVRSIRQLREAADLGAEFTVAPGFDPVIVNASRDLRISHLPGVATSTDIHNALNAGLTWVKAFPAAELGPSWIRAQLAPFPEARFVATGGIGAHNAHDFIEAGCRAVAIGSAFDDPAQLLALRERGLIA